MSTSQRRKSSEVRPYIKAGALFRTLRTAAGATNAQIARATNAHIATVKQWMVGRLYPDPDKLLLAFNAMRTPMADRARLAALYEAERRLHKHDEAGELLPRPPRRLTLVNPAGPCDGDCAKHQGKMAPGAGERDDDCAHYEACFDEVVFAHPIAQEVHCPKACTRRAARPRPKIETHVGHWDAFAY